jgi:hypothetical protein
VFKSKVAKCQNFAQSSHTGSTLVRRLKNKSFIAFLSSSARGHPIKMLFQALKAF